MVIANSLHFERDKLAVLRLVGGYLRPAGRLVLVEYDIDHGNPWVPFPLSFRSWTTLAAEAGFRDSQRLASVPSRSSGRSTRPSATAERFSRPPAIRSPAAGQVSESDLLCPSFLCPPRGPQMPKAAGSRTGRSALLG